MAGYHAINPRPGVIMKRCRGMGGTKNNAMALEEVDYRIKSLRRWEGSIHRVTSNRASPI